MSVITRSKALDALDALNDTIVNLRMVLADQAHSMGGADDLWESQVEMILYDASKALRRAKSHVR
jgi:hypothetical protein